MGPGWMRPCSVQPFGCLVCRRWCCRQHTVSTHRSYHCLDDLTSRSSTPASRESPWIAEMEDMLGSQPASVGVLHETHAHRPLLSGKAGSARSFSMVQQVVRPSFGIVSWPFVSPVYGSGGHRTLGVPAPGYFEERYGYRPETMANVPTQRAQWPHPNRQPFLIGNPPPRHRADRTHEPWTIVTVQT